MNARIRVVSAVSALLCATSAFAQVAQPPPRPSRPRLGGGPPADPNRVRHDLTLDAFLLGGYQDNVAPPLQSTQGVAPRPTAMMTSGDVGLRYTVGTPDKGLDISGHGSANYASTYRRAGMPPGYGADVSAGGRIGLGQSTKLSASQNVQVSPYSSLGLFGGLGNGANSGSSMSAFGAGMLSFEGNMANALFEGRTWTMSTSGSLDHQWTRSTSTTLSYGFNRQAHEDRSLLDNRSHMGRLQFSRHVGRAAFFRGAYSASASDMRQAGRVGNSLNHNLDAGVGFSRRISRTRTLAVSGGGGATHFDLNGIRAVRQRYWSPSAYASANVDVGRSWTVAVDWRQSTNILPSPVIAPKTFLSRTAHVQLGGHVGNRVELVFSGSNSNGMLGTPLPGELGSYAAYTGNAQVRIEITRWWSAIASLNHYQAVLSGVVAEALGTSPNFHRNSVMVGFGWSVPLMSDGGRRQPRGGRR